jgi:hypothetical protein
LAAPANRDHSKPVGQTLDWNGARPLAMVAALLAAMEIDR